MAVQFNIRVFGDQAVPSRDDVGKTVNYAFHLSDEEYKEMFAALCAGCDTDRFDHETLETVIRKMSLEEVLEN